MADDKGVDAGADDTKLDDKAGTILDAADKGGDDKGSADQGDKGADKGVTEGTAEPDWRARLAGDDKDLQRIVARYTDEAAFGKAHRSLLAKLSSGEYRKALPENATAEEKATWRKENGLPEKADDYVTNLALPSGIVIGEAEKPVVSALAAVAHEGNIDPKAFNGLVSKYYELQDQQRQAQEDADAQYKVTAEDALRKDWQGADYRRNLTAVNNLLATWPEGVAQSLLGGRGPDGRLLGDNPALIRQLASLALELNPAATLVPSGTTDAGKTVASRLKEIRELRRNDPDKYERDKDIQKEELELIEADLKMQARGKAA
jgi:hypothetical protein